MEMAFTFELAGGNEETLEVDAHLLILERYSVDNG